VGGLEDADLLWVYGSIAFSELERELFRKRTLASYSSFPGEKCLDEPGAIGGA
jgi:hypothetical protein